MSIFQYTNNISFLENLERQICVYKWETKLKVHNIIFLQLLILRHKNGQQARQDKSIYILSQLKAS